MTSLLTSSIPPKLSGFTNNQVVHSTLKIWFQFRRHFKFNAASTLAPILRNHLFRPAFTDSTFSIWHNKGLKCFKDLYKDGIFRSFILSGEFHLPLAHLFRYFQIRHCAKVLFTVFPSSPLSLQWEELLTHFNSHLFLKSIIKFSLLIPHQLQKSRQLGSENWV